MANWDSLTLSLFLVCGGYYNVGLGVDSKATGWWELIERTKPHEERESCAVCASWDWDGAKWDKTMKIKRDAPRSRYYKEYQMLAYI